MKLLKGIGIGLSLTVACLLAAPTAKADQVDRKTIVTFSGPVEVPGVGAQTLPAGTYVFKVLRSDSNRHIVQILNEEETHVFTTVLAIPNFRLKPTDKTVITFHEHPAGQPEALRAWFYPGREWGEEFVYERSRAIALAKESNENVLTTSVLQVDTMTTAPVEGVSPSGETVATAAFVEPPPAPAIITAPVVETPVQMASLPKTASNLSLTGLLGLLSLGAGFVLLGFSKRIS